MRYATLVATFAAVAALVAVPAVVAPVPDGVPAKDSAAVEEVPRDGADSIPRAPLDQLAGFSDVEAYKFLVLVSRTEQPRSPKVPWKDDALGYVVSWTEFIERYPKSPLVSHAYLRMADWYLTIRKGDDREDWYARSGTLDQAYAALALALINRVIYRFPNDPYLAYMGNGEFAWNDKVGAVALYMRGLIFRDTCKKDLARLRRDYPNSPSTRDARAHFSRVCF
ncbi:MAG: hypothetical protein Q8Q41_00045 [bacterium]|nr:hypothetical protein [bacterium]